MTDETERRADLIATYAEQLEQDLAYAAPEMWPIHIRRRMEELADDLQPEQESQPT